MIAHTIAPFLVERPYEQVKLDFGYQGLGGTLASVGAPYDYGTEGGTHHAPGDVQAMLTIPGAEVLVPGSAAELDVLLRGTYANGRLTYLRASGAAERPVVRRRARPDRGAPARVARHGGRGGSVAEPDAARPATTWTSRSSTPRACVRSTPTVWRPWWARTPW